MPVSRLREAQQGIGPSVLSFGGEGRSEKIMLKQKVKPKCRID